MKKGHPLVAKNHLRLALAGSSALALMAMSYSTLAATASWTGGGTDANWSTSGNWSSGSSPSAGDALVFDGVTQTTISNDFGAGALFNGLTFNSAAGAFTLGGNAINLGGDIINNSTNLQTINLNLALTATRSINTASGDISIGGVISGTGFGLTKTGANTLTLTGANIYTGTTTISAGTLKLGANNALPTGPVTLSSGGTSNTLDLAGFSQTITTLASNSTVNNGGTITSSAAGGSLTLNEGTANGNIFGGTLFTGSLALTIRGNNANNLQIQNTANTFSGGLTIQSTGAALTTSNLATAGGLTGQATEGVRSSTAAALGTGSIKLDNGLLFLTSSQNVTNNLSVTANGGVLHMEGTGSGASGGFSGTLSSTNSTLLVINSNSGNSNIIKLSGDMSGFSGTVALDTTNLGGIALNGSALGNSNINLLWFGNGTNGGTGRVQAANATSQTYTFGELNNLNSGAVGSTMSGIIEDSVASTTATFSIGNSNSTTATFQGVIRNGSGTVALTKTGNNSQILSGANTYTGATTVNGGTLNIKGSLAAGSAVSVNNGGTLAANGIVNGSVTVNSGGALAGSGTVAGAVSIASGSTASSQGSINLIDGGVGTLTLSNAAGLTLGDSSGGFSLLKFEVNSTSADKLLLGANVLTTNLGGANISITSLGVVANQTYDLINFGSGTGAGFSTGSGVSVGSFTLANPSLSFGVSGVLNVTNNAVQLVTSGASAPSVAYWSGAKGGAWGSNDGVGGNFTTDAEGTSFVAAYPAATTDVIFSGSGASNFTNTLGQSFDVKSVTFSGSNAVTINGDGNILTVESGGLYVQSGAGNVSIGATLAGPGGVTNEGNLTLSGTNTYSGGTVVNSGTLTVGSTSALGSTSGALVANGGTVDLNGNSVAVGALSGGDGAVITNNSSSANVTLTTSSGASTTYSGVLSDGSNGKTLALSKSGSGTLTLNGSNSYSGGTSIFAGTLQLGNGSALGTGNATVSSGAAIDLNGQTISNSLSVSGTGAGGGGALINSNVGTQAVVLGNIPSSNFTVGGSGDISLTKLNQANSGVFTVTKAGSGTLYLTGTTLNYLMALAVNGGTVVLNKQNADSTSDWAIDRGATITNGTLLIGAAGKQIQPDQAITVNGGAFDLGGFSTPINSLAGTGGVVTNSGTAAVTLTVGATQNSSTTASSTYAGVLQDGLSTLALSKSGTSTFTLSGNNSYSGGTTINGGTVVMANANALGSTAGNLAINSGKLDLNGNSLSVGALSGSGTGGIITSSVAAGALTLAANSSATTTFAGSIQDGSATVALVKSGAGTLTLSASSTYSGGTVINAGTLVQTSAAALGTGAIVVGDGFSSNSATLQGAPTGSITNSNPITIAAGGSGIYTVKNTSGSDYNFSGNIALNNAATFQTTANGAMFISGTITGSSNLTIDGANSTTKFVELDANNSATFTGNVLVQNKGILKTHNGGLGASNVVTMDSTATFDNGTQSVTIAGITDAVAGAGGSSLVLAGAGTTFSVAGGGNYSFSGVVSNSGGFAMNGSGSQTLAGANTYTGATTANSGKLVIAGSLNGTSALLVAAGATLASGTAGSSSLIAPSATTGNAVNINGTLSPADAGSIGAINFTLAGTSKVNFNSGASLSLDVGASNSSDVVSFGSAGDWLSGSGNLTLTLSGAVDYSSSYTVFHNVTTAGFGLAGITGYDSVNYTAQFSQVGDDYMLSFVAVPEPATWSMILGGLGMLAFGQKLRRNRRTS